MDEEAQAYFRTVEEHFIDRRGRPLLLSPGDVNRVAVWYQGGIPLAAVLEGIDVHFERMARRNKPARRAVTLAYVEDDVLEAWAGARRRRLGSVPAAEGEAQAPGGVVEHARFLEDLAACAARLWSADETSQRIAPLVEEAAEKLERKRALFDPAREEHDAQKAEETLRRIERTLQAAIRKAAGEAAVAGFEREVEADLAEKRSRMEDATWQRVRNQLVDKRLRERFGLPRLSLFYT